MPRTGCKPPSDPSLSDHLAVGALARVFPPELVDRVVAEAGRTERRERLLPARLVVYYVLGLALYGSRSYAEVMRNVVAGLSCRPGWRPPQAMPTKAALFRARERLGPEPLEALFAAVAAPLADARTAGAFHDGLRLVGIERALLDVADTPANERGFGRAGGGARPGASGGCPQVRALALGECGSGAPLGIALGPLATSDTALAARLLDALEPGMLCIAGPGLGGRELWERARETGAELLWRAADGEHPDAVRVIHDEPAGGDARGPLLTTLLDPDRAPAAELAELYARRRRFADPPVVLRSRTPQGVIQEAYGHFCVRYAVRWQMHEPALSQLRPAFGR